MSNFLLQFAISNLLLSLLMASVAYAVHRSQRSPALAHLLWVLVLAKLVTPPIFSIPAVPCPDIRPQAASAPIPGTDALLDIETDQSVVESKASTVAGPAKQSANFKGFLIAVPPTGVFALWIVGGLFVLFRSLKSVFRFNRRLRSACRRVAPDIQRLAAEVAERLRLRSRPEIYSVPAEISPFVWWLGGRARVVIPEKVEQQFDPYEIKLILAHELAHIKRRDYLVRWLEWLACVVFWWNPVVWWARRCLRVDEELCCDAMVLNALHPDPQRYGLLLLHVVELLTSPGFRPPAEACAIDSGGSLERRFRMIVSMNTIENLPRWLSGGVLTLVMGLLPLGIAYGQDFDAVERRLEAAVANGEISQSQAQAMIREMRVTDEEREFRKKQAAMEKQARQAAEIFRRHLAARKEAIKVHEQSVRAMEQRIRLQKAFEEQRKAVGLGDDQFRAIREAIEQGTEAIEQGIEAIEQGIKAQKVFEERRKAEGLGIGDGQ